ncbi:hypothetical protein KBD33_01185 [Candidatus Gracilibacteria bacterium]|nr:hypothetical protein [Candidatus Gracilibacteria bacterium]
MFDSIYLNYNFVSKKDAKPLGNLLNEPNIYDKIHWEWISDYDPADIPDVSDEFPELDETEVHIEGIRRSDFYKHWKDELMVFHVRHIDLGNEAIVQDWGLLDGANDAIIKVELTITDRDYTRTRYDYGYTLADKIVQEARKISHYHYCPITEDYYDETEDPIEIQRTINDQYKELYETACKLIENVTFLNTSHSDIKQEFLRLIQIGKGTYFNS